MKGRHKHAVVLTFFLLCLFPPFLFLQRQAPSHLTYIENIEEEDVISKASLEEYRLWFRNCTHLLLDLGANRGDTILRWFSNESYSGRSRTSSIDKVYSFELRTKFCVLSFEPNDIFKSALINLEKELIRKGFKVKIKPHTAVFDRFGESVIYLDNTSSHAYGSSLMSEKKVNFKGRLHALGKEQHVNLVDLAKLLKAIPKAVEVVVKMDIEGSEYDILRALISSGIACRINTLIIEYHFHKLRKGSVPAGVNEVLEWLLTGSNCGVRVIRDD